MCTVYSRITHSTVQEFLHNVQYSRAVIRYSRRYSFLPGVLGRLAPQPVTPSSRANSQVSTSFLTISPVGISPHP